MGRYRGQTKTVPFYSSIPYVRWLLKSNESCLECVFLFQSDDLFVIYFSPFLHRLTSLSERGVTLNLSYTQLELFANGPFCSPVLLTFSSFAAAWRVGMGFLNCVAILLTVLINPATHINPTFVCCVFSICLNSFRV